jgi:hypothetical protein
LNKLFFFSEPLKRAVCLLCTLFRFVSQSLPLLPVHSRCRGCLFSLDHTQTHTTVCSTPLDEGSARRIDLYLTTQTLYKTNIHAPRGIRAHGPNKRSAADLRLRPRGHWDRLCKMYQIYFDIYSTIKEICIEECFLII